MSKAGTIAFWVFFGVVIAALIVAIVILIIEIVLYDKIRRAVQGATYNSTACENDRCGWINIHPRPPDEFPDEFSRDIALYCAQQVINLEYYEANGRNLHLPPELELLGTANTAESGAPLFAYIACDNQRRVMYVVLRGTITMDEWELDLEFPQVKFALDRLGTTGSINWTCSSDVLVHSGFYEMFQQVREQIELAVLRGLENSDRVIVTGHSLGGAESSLFGVYISSNLTAKPVYVYSFGKPRVGNDAYIKCVNSHFQNRFWRIENFADPVPAVPTAATPNLSNYDQPYLYDHEGVGINYSSNWGSLSANHSMRNYIDFLQSA